MQDKFRIDELYDAVIIRPIKAIASGLYRFVDRIIVDKILVEGTGALVDVFSRLAGPCRAATASATWRCSPSASALLVIRSQPTLPFSKLKVTQTGRGVDVDARRASPARRPGRSNTSSTSVTDAR